MSECPFVPDCVLFCKTLAGLPEVAMLMKARHCQREYASCALLRIYVEAGPATVPAGLFPNQTGQADLIIRESEQAQ